MRGAAAALSNPRRRSVASAELGSSATSLGGRGVRTARCTPADGSCTGEMPEGERAKEGTRPVGEDP
eukprot:scaffold175416_cov27-Tisochrysis_lutea.AAC.2